MESKRMNRKGKGVLTTFFIAFTMFCLAFLTMFNFYGGIINEEHGYGYLNITDYTSNPAMDKLHTQVDYAFDEIYEDAEDMESSFIDKDSSKDTGESNMITNSFSMVKKLFKNTFGLIDGVVQVMVTETHIPAFWIYGVFTIIIMVIFIAVIGSFLRAPNL